jgi:Tfp pilus assembly protein PilX
MNRLRMLVDNERGVALVMALTILLTLTGLVVAFLAVSAFEPQISRNHVDSVQVRHVAESGIEYAYNTLLGDMLNNTPWSNRLVGATCTTGVVLGAANTTLPGLSSAHGTFTVLVRNDCKANDNKLTGVAVENAANATNDTNNKLILISTGTIGNTTRTITVVISRANFPPIAGALSFPGLQSDVNFSGSAFDIDGRDHMMTDAANSPTGAANAVLGISAATAAEELTIETAVANNQGNDVRGKDQNSVTNPPATTIGSNTIAVDTTQTPQTIAEFVNAVKDYADIKITSTPSSPYSINNIGSTCATDVKDSQCWGTAQSGPGGPATPKIVYIKGDLPNLSTQMTSLSVSGTSVGTGILIVEGGNVNITGNFRWNGPIIITGNNVGIRYQGGGNQEVYGTTIVNEQNNNEAPNLEGEVSGNAKILYSNQALTLVRNLLIRRMVRTYSWSDQ